MLELLDTRSDTRTPIIGKTWQWSRLPPIRRPAKWASRGPDFPLFPHATNRWAKKVRGKLEYFGSVTADPEGKAALDKWLNQKDALLAGRRPRVSREGFTVREICNRFLTNRQDKMRAGELSPVSFADYHATCAKIVKAFGTARIVDDLDASDFEHFRRSMAKRWGPVTLSKRNPPYPRSVSLCRAKPVGRRAYSLRAASSSRHRAACCGRNGRARGCECSRPNELRAILDEAETPLKAMVLLAINTGLGHYDITCLPSKAINLKTAWLDYPRQKTSIGRRCPLLA